MAQWWEHVTPTYVTRVRIPVTASYVGWVCCWPSPCSGRFFSGYSGFPLSSKTNTTKFQFDPECTDTCWIRSWALLRCSVGKKIPFPFLFFFSIFTYYPVDIVGPRSSFTTSASVRSSILGERFESVRPRCAPATVLYSNYSIAALFGHQSASSDGVLPSLVVSLQKRAFAVQLRNGAAGCVLETTDSLNCNENKRKPKYFTTNFVQKCTELAYRAIFNRVSIAFLANCLGLWLLHSVIGWKFSLHFFNQSEVKPKPIVAHACTFSCALCRLRVNYFEFWLVYRIASVLFDWPRKLLWFEFRLKLALVHLWAAGSLHF